MKNLFNKYGNYNQDEVNKWRGKLEKEVYPLIDRMMDEGYRYVDIKQFVADEIAFHICFREATTKIERYKDAKDTN